MPRKSKKQRSKKHLENEPLQPGDDSSGKKPVIEINVFSEVTAEDWASSDSIILDPELLRDQNDEVLCRLFDVGIIKAREFLQAVKEEDLPDNTRLYFRCITLHDNGQGVGGDASASIEDLVENGTIYGGLVLAGVVSNLCKLEGASLSLDSMLLCKVSMYPPGLSPEALEDECNRFASSC